MSHMSWYVWVLALTAAIGIPGMAAIVVGQGARKAGQGRIVAAGIVVAWLAVSATLAGIGVYQRGGQHVLPWFGVAVVVGLTGALLASRLPAVRRALEAPGMASRLELPHTFRIEGVVFLILMAQGQLPAVFALPAGIGDILTGLFAPLVARRLARGVGTRGATWFALFGMVDLITALSIGFLAGLGPVLVLHGAGSTLPVSQLPLVLIPTVAVPTAIALHVVSLAQLRRRATAGARRASVVPATA
jgi:hypothetical protein